MDQSALQRYYNEHIHLPHAFFVQPERFIRQALKRRGDFLPPHITTLSRIQKMTAISSNIFLPISQ